ncbi:hypothetical protein [Desulfosoma sp.]|uniref:hypothetical protein n=1 Tax=Desulfosoma sp. TaxID=2603217 RepID=UPI0040492A31
MLCALLSAGCATKQQIQQNYIQNMAARVDMSSVNDHAQFQIDLATCSDLAAQWYLHAPNETVASSLAGAILGAGLGYGLGRAWRTHNNLGWAATGAAAGAAGGLQSVENHADTVFKNCMINRAYKLLW